ncbi:MAG: pyrroloquinoline quinone-dependent dehydrogenase [Gammaproteobacteria bacterium]|jgi:quinoprotein glucose dehydrogenase|nr:pyrroloquinoline quinone-dependent dehydrogenase [Gammaproteobacteria bacterium]MBT3860695.1 pyrroloquinoline quinone-dependent dehydrogenase [Gammaproteobacteria bacterium]MBT3988323.1 pyrroloquinoline quinone-dependent dehydrogenase [Gammaproteobacteria bacterium]MBT4254618.1 pyrroloquinoline quinone-dependent dehydrogenase [Gammaproteobacteria bacterium]MBT4657460.1 pyrroloquinoline quinone-dependent dehydrogenase [Gammaproteobacteria bacterium]
MITRIPHKLAILAFFLIGSISVQAQDQDWPSYGGDNGSRKYSPLDQINADNVDQLEAAWTWTSVDNATVAQNIADENFRAMPAGFKATPIVVDGVMYIPTSYGRIAAIDAATGEEKWVFDTTAWETGRPPNLGYNSRGVGYWEKGNKKRVFFATNDAVLWSIDVTTGQPDADFGEGGRVDLTQGLGREIDRRQYGVVSPPLVTNDIVVVNSIINDGPTTKEMPPGHVRGFNPDTGAVEWMFHTIPQAGEFGNETWEDGSWEYTGNTNSWTIMSADDELGIVYLPIGTPTNDWYGGLRKGDNLFAESLVAVEAKTGKYIWHFQMVHHGVWDYDLPAAPALVDIVVDGRPIKAVAQISKQGHTYVFDRVTGEPVWPIEERAVAQSSVPGERLSPTQPFPTKPPPFSVQGITDATLINFTPELRNEALQIIERFDYGPLFTPPSLRGTINMPGWGGGGWWTGSSFDPDTGLFYVPSASIPIVVQLVEADPEQSNLQYVRGGAQNVGGPQGLPLTKPPYGRITAINLNRGDHEWMVPHGEGMRQQIIDMGILDPGPVGGPSRTGPVLTKTLLFIAQTDVGRNLLRAYDKATGNVVHEIELPLPPQATPMSYSVNGKQYISIALGGGPDSRVYTLALP